MEICREWAYILSRCGGVGMLLENCTILFCNKLCFQLWGVWSAGGRFWLSQSGCCWEFHAWRLHGVLFLLRLEIIPAGENVSCLIDYSGWQDVSLRYSARYSLYHYST